MPKTYNCKSRLILKAEKRYVRRNGTVTKPLRKQGKFLQDEAEYFLYNVRNGKIAYVFDRTRPDECDLMELYTDPEE